MSAIGSFLMEHSSRPQIKVISDLEELTTGLQRRTIDVLVVHSNVRHVGPIANICEYCQVADVACYVIGGENHYSGAVIVDSAESAAKKILHQGQY